MIKHSDMELIQRRIEVGDASLVDNEIVKKFLTWLPSYNCESAAEGYFSILSSIAKYKPQIIEPLLKKAIEPIYFLGYDSSKDIIGWASHFANSSNVAYKPSESGRVWLTHELPNYEEFIERCLKEYMSE
ncbi:hypothetical protein GCM10023310_30960 [Paenibacillus vulneris]|uniref:Uncharacterized protein n=1 Tax=Paenibacillus vulneris TaxID=1133364 RepID=A0ABW3UR53_9BACL|nr:hypothetical protein [Paenibacillus sp. 32352]